MVSFWLPSWVFAWAEHTGLPAAHPGLVPPSDGAMEAKDTAWGPDVGASSPDWDGWRSA
jgi:hypothetical protein